MSNKIRVPSYRRHKPTNQGVVTLSGKDVYLGAWGTAASKQKYRQLVAKWLLNSQRPSGSDLTIAELAAKYWQHVERWYIKDGLPTSEQHLVKGALRPLLRLYETCLVEDFTPHALKTVWDEMIATGWTRRTVNRQTDRIRRMFRWGVEEQLVPAEVTNALLCVSGLRRGRCSVRESEPVKPVDDATIEATLPHLTRTVADMVRVQLLAAMRPAEVCSMRPMDLDRSGDIWIYTPSSHKCEHHEKQRLVFLGPQSQEILLSYLARDAAMYCFRPVDSESKRRAERHASRKTPLN